MTTANIFRLKASIQEYEWGKPGSSSLVAKYANAAVGDEYKVEDTKHYAEIWMGTHKNGPASVWNSPDITLHGLIMASPRVFLGARLTTPTFTQDAKFPHSTDVPFLFKILSIAKALPLQAHPDKELGEKLNKEDAVQFFDSNHKPEIAVALADGFKGFVGFREPKLIAKDLENIPELGEAIANDEEIARFIREQDKASLKLVFSKLLSTSTESVSQAVSKLMGRVKRHGAAAIGGNTSQTDLVKILNAQYPQDVGVLAAPFFMNLVTLNRGEAIYIGADEAHAYLEGDIIECMAVSDNVLNAAFVPPDTRNTRTFTESLTYTAREPNHWLLEKTPYKRSRTGRTTAFDPPLEEFTVLWTKLREHEGGEEYLENAEGPTIGIVTRGTIEFEEQGPDRDKLVLGEGAIIFVKPKTDLIVRSTAEEGEVWWSTCVE
ncbi:mannose-6-phosphate isomerase [Fomitiporia mediterranea MF3/22]|uniref:mannose-6-phosphate isomerase n=1 Tax=Fomitiporia mediterranea (strain MF3/22) TaxID=694068 RepID=UPI000440738C|nr:mannose-6-phosphate isomerase [Fomitiporia mediterranea MF3/22]EJC97908.1 mannose-6-phosphate isomerase [Fomitiporia mediterranea MF3/22]